MKVKFQRWWEIFKREVWFRRLPHGLIHWRYLLPRPERRIRAHRKIWWHSGQRWPRPLWLAVEVFLWVRWVFYYAWITSWRSAQLWKMQESLGLSTRSALEGFAKGLYLALAWCIPPGDARRFGLFESPDQATDFVYDHEVHAYHDLRNQPRGCQKASLRLLQDKSALSDFLIAQGIPMAPIIAVIPRGDVRPLSALISSDGVFFCKMRSGNQGRGAFTAWRERGCWKGRTFHGQVLETPESVESVWRSLLMLDDALIQPYLMNHPDLAALAFDQQTVTIRLISTWDSDGLSCLLSTLEVPTHSDAKTQTTLYTILPIRSDTGQVVSWPNERPLPAQAQEATQQILNKIPQGWAIPHWHALVEASFKAHATFPDIRSIAWDWAITPEGPRLLEGNSGWGASLPQQRLGGFLRDGII